MAVCDDGETTVQDHSHRSCRCLGGTHGAGSRERAIHAPLEACNMRFWLEGRLMSRVRSSRSRRTGSPRSRFMRRVAVLAALQQFNRCASQIGRRVRDTFLTVMGCDTAPTSHQAPRYDESTIAPTAPRDVRSRRSALVGSGNSLRENLCKSPQKGVIHSKTDDATRPACGGLAGVQCGPNGAATDIARMKPSQFGIGIPT